MTQREQAEVMEKAQPAGSEPILSVHELYKHFPVIRGILRRKIVGAVRAVDGVNLEIGPNETVGLVGESGCGKSTLARLIARLETPSSGEVRFHGKNIFALEGEGLRAYRQGVQMVFQDPYSSLNPRITIGRSIMRAWESNPDKLARAERRERARRLLEQVGLSSDRIDWYPHQLSGGQRQRVAIARALALDPALVICDEPVSALDVSIQAQILAVLDRLQKELGMSYLFISHDLDVVERISHRVVVMYLGRIVESGTVKDIFRNPAHPYTEALLAASPRISPTGRPVSARPLLQGDPPNPANPPSGCRFRTRCPKAKAICAEQEPILASVGSKRRRAACHFPN